MTAVLSPPAPLAHHDAPSAPPRSPPSGPVTATITHYAPPPSGDKPYNYVCDPPPGVPVRNYSSATVSRTINDARGSESHFSTDKQGFTLVSGVPSHASFDTDPTIEESYYPEVRALLLSRLGAQRVFIFDHTLRRQTGDRNPVLRAHVDQTAKAAEERVRLHLGDEAEALLKGRVRIVNVWRPLNGRVETFPLAMAESDSVPEVEMVAVEHRYADRTGETAGVAAGDGQRWWYWSGMDDDERILLQCYDSEKGKRVPHTAFVDPRTEGPGWKGRESIEVRALVFG